MKMNVLSSVALTHLRARFKQSVIAALGVTFGIAMYTTLMGFMTGLNGMLDGLILDRTPHVRLYNEIEATEVQPVALAPELTGDLLLVHSVKPKQTQQKIRNSLALIDELRRDPRVVGVAPQVQARVFFNAGPINLNGVVQGVDVEAEEQFFSLQNYIVEGSLSNLISTPNSIILGKGLADKLLADMGDVVQVTSPTGNRFNLKVVGYYQSGLADIDNQQSYANLATAQKILGEPDNYITDINVKLYDVEKAPGMAREFAHLYDIDALDIQRANAQFETGTNIRNLITIAVSIALLIVAGFGIYNILNMMIYEKMDDIAILKATGFEARDVLYIFLMQAMIIGIVGGMLGLVIGLGLSVAIDNAPFETEALPTITTFPINFNPLYYVGGMGFALATTFLAGLMPARKAGRIDPVEIIRGK